MIQELLEKRDNLFEIAAVLYGDMFIAEPDFWDSPTERDLKEVYEKLDLFGYEDKEPTNDMIQAAEVVKKIADKKRNSKK
jgi:hypothetical protein